MVQGPAPLRRRYKVLRSNKSWLEQPPTLRYKLPRGVRSGTQEARDLEREAGEELQEKRKLWERCVRLCAQVRPLGVLTSTFELSLL